MRREKTEALRVAAGDHDLSLHIPLPMELTATMWGFDPARACIRCTSSAACTVMIDGRRNSHGMW